MILQIFLMLKRRYLNLGNKLELILDMRKSDRKLLIDACINFYAQELKINKNKFCLIVKSIRGLIKNTDAAGSAYHVPKYLRNDKLSSKMYFMQLDSGIEMEKLIQTIAHEMVHIKQFVKGQITYKGRSMYWLGNRVVKSRINYYDQPWEIDAWSKEKVLSAKIYKILTKLEDKHYAKFKL